ncbi:MBL fold metallo-hydrolase [Streptomyces silaceus]|uniref:MBL fold metallo-hydrolase n=1 Tax=Streptomyces TaxID=1883 RepID=UPI0006EB462B|nr:MULTISPECIES: MBL fold metallo-hydrolase [Streptomyces]
MTVTGMSGKLRAIGQDVHAWLPPRHGWGLANCGLLVSRDTALWIDTPYDHQLARAFLAQSGAVLPEGVTVDRIVVTHPNGDHMWGAGVLPRAEIIASRQAREHLHFDPHPQQQHALVGAVDPTTPWGAYVVEHFGGYDWSTVRPVAVSTAFTEELELTVGAYPVHLSVLPSGHTQGDLFVHLPAQRVVFTGDTVFGSSPEQPGDHPVHWAGPLAQLISSCRRMLETGAETFVPGHGPVLDAAGLRGHIDYLEYVQERAHACHAAGLTAAEAARSVIDEGRHPELGLPERLLVTIGSEYRGIDGGGQPDMVATMQQVAALAWDLRTGEAPPAGRGGRP